jgi:excisionase family DNA binding protein
MMALITTSEAAERLGVHITRVQQFIRSKRLPAEKVGRDWLIEEKDLALVGERKTGRPPKAESAKSAAKNAAARKSSKKWGAAK